MSKTLVSVHCYAGDLHQVQDCLQAYTHHGCQVVIVSPTDSPVVIDHSGVDNLYSGLVGYTGQVSLDRQLAQMRALLRAYPEHEFFLLNDSDSAVLDPTIPKYLFEEDVVWSNVVIDNVPNREPFPDGWPHVAFQPPYFLSRAMMEKMVTIGDNGSPMLKATRSRPFIDFYMVQLTMVGELPWRCMKDAISWPISINKVAHPTPHKAQIEMYARGILLASEAVSQGGTTIVHSVKDGDTMRLLMEKHRIFRAENPDWRPRDRILPRAGRASTPSQAARLLAQVQRRGLITPAQSGDRA